MSHGDQYDYGYGADEVGHSDGQLERRGHVPGGDLSVHDEGFEYFDPTAASAAELL